jgi:hydroxypyruvate reductase
MVAGALDVLGDAIRGGLAVVPANGPTLPSFETVEIVEGSHPLPDARSEAAGLRLLAEAAALGREETALVLLSGGASSLAAVPVADSSIEELAAISEQLLRSGAPISEINALRSSLSRLHGGGLSAAIGARPARTLAISDVPGDRPGDIGSAPMHQDRPAGERCFEIVAAARIAAQAAARVLAAAGFAVELDASGLEHEAAGEALGRLRRLEAAGNGARALVSWGEPVVTVNGSGAGGRCSHAALAAALRLGARPAAACECVFLALATDGRDGGSASGGALVDRGSLARMGSREAEQALSTFDSATVLRASSDLLEEVPSGSNVADLWLCLRAEAEPGLVLLEESPGLRLPQAAGAHHARAELASALAAAAARLPDAAELAVVRAWTPEAEGFAAGSRVELEDPSAIAREALLSQGLSEDPRTSGCWEGREPAGPIARPSWMNEP